LGGDAHGDLWVCYDRYEKRTAHSCGVAGTYPLARIFIVNPFVNDIWLSAGGDLLDSAAWRAAHLHPPITGSVTG
jgi:hypothetical protein